MTSPSTMALQLRMLLWKWMLSKRRRPMRTMAEVFLPAILMLLMNIGSVINGPQLTGAPSVLRMFGSLPLTPTLPQLLLSTSWPRPAAWYNYPFGVSPLAVDVPLLPWRIGFAPSTDAGVAAIMSAASALLDAQFPSPIASAVFVPFADASALEAGMRASIGGTTDAPIVLGVQFDSVAPASRQYAYTLRGNASYFPTTGSGDQEVLRGDPYGVLGSAYSGSFAMQQATGATQLQLLLNRAILQLNGAPSTVLSNVTQLPLPLFQETVVPLPAAAAMFTPLLPVYALGFFVAFMLASVIADKIKHVKEGLQQVGVSEGIYWVAVIIVHSAEAVVLAAIFTGILFATNVSYSNPGIVFVFLWVYLLASISFGCALSTFFRREEAGQNVGILAPIIYIVIWAPVVILAPYNGTLKTVLCIAPGIGMFAGYAHILSLEYVRLGAQVDNVMTPVNGLTLGYVMLVLALDAFFWLAVTVYLHNVLPIATSFPRPWWYPIAPCVRRRLMNRAGTYDASTPLAVIAAAENRTASGALVHVEHLRKTFPAPSAAPSRGLLMRCCKRGAATTLDTGKAESAEFVAVDDVSFSMEAGQVFALVGLNGAGKSTTISMLAGLLAPSAGAVLLDGVSVSASSADRATLRRSIGLCPQYDIPMEDLTGRESLLLMGRLNGLHGSSLDALIDDTLRAVGLQDARNKLVATYSGGMKRRVTLAMALMGGQDLRCIILDEPTAGLDPVSRRLVWEVVQAQKARGRALLLCTHFMDEADLLGDTVAVMKAGRIIAEGSALSLKHQYDCGYILTAVLHSGDGPPVAHAPQALLAFLTERVPGVRLVAQNGSEVSFAFPATASTGLGTMFADIEAQQVSLGIRDYALGMTTLESVFLRAADANSTAAIDVAPDVHDVLEMSEPPAQADEEPVLTGFARARAHVAAIMYQRWLAWKRSMEGVVLTYCLPIAYSIGAFAAAASIKSSSAAVTPLSADPAAILGAAASSSSMLTVPHRVGIMSTGGDACGGTCNLANTSALAIQIMMSMTQPLASPTPGQSSLAWATFSSPGDVLTAALDAVAAYGTPAQTTSAVPLSAIVGIGANNASNALIAHNTSIPAAVMATVSSLSTSLLRNITAYDASLPGPAPYIQTSVFPISVPSGFDLTAFLGPMLLGLALTSTLIPGPVTSVSDVEKGTRLQLRIMGVDRVMYRVGNLAFDFLYTASLAVIMSILIFAFDFTGLEGARFAGWAVMVVLWTLAAVPFAYALALPFKRLATAVRILPLAVIFTGVLPYIITRVIQGQEASSTSHIADGTYDRLCHGFLVFPSFAFYHAIDTLMSLDSKMPGGRPVALLDVFSSANGNDIPLILGVLAAVGLACSALVLAVDHMDVWIGSAAARNASSLSVEPAAANESDYNDAVECEMAARLSSGAVAAGEGSVLASHVSHGYPQAAGGVQLAVKDVTIAIPRGHIRVLLGPNGAGKTSLISCITGAVQPLRGIVAVNGRDPASGFSFGYCPQDAALWENLSVTEHLQVFGLLKGLRGPPLAAAVRDAIVRMDLLPHARKLSAHLSGGNRRKLCVAVALLGAPRAAVLDEPSTGIDPVSRRHLWATLTHASTTAAMLVSTHSMEEAEVIADVITVMMDGKVVASADSTTLKRMFGGGYLLELELTPGSAPAVLAALRACIPEMVVREQVRNTVKAEIPHAVSKGAEATAGGVEGLSLSSLFSAIADVQQALPGTVRFYALSNSSLEQAFMHMATRE